MDPYRAPARPVETWGQPIQTLPRSLTARVLAYLFLVPMTLGLFYLAWVVSKQHNPGPGPTILIVFALMFLFFTTWIIWHESTRGVWVHPEGIKVKQYSKVTAIGWDEVDEIYLVAIKMQAGGLIGMAVSAAVEALSKDPFDLDKSSTNVTVRINGGGKKLKFSKSDKGCVQAFRFASDQVNPRLLDKYARVVREAGMAVFGKIALSMGGVSFNGKAPIPFAEIEKLSVEGGFIKAKKRGKWLNAGSVMTRVTPNAMVLITLFDTLTGNTVIRTEKDLVGRQFV